MLIFRMNHELFWYIRKIAVLYMNDLKPVTLTSVMKGCVHSWFLYKRAGDTVDGE